MRDFLVETGYDRDMGARPMVRTIQELIKKPLAEMVLFGDVSSRGGVVEITMEAGEIQIQEVVEAMA